MSDEKLAYRLLTGTDDRAFCEKVSAALADGYRLHGGPTLTFDGTRVVAAQAVVLLGGSIAETVPADVIEAADAFTSDAAGDATPQAV